LMLVNVRRQERGFAPRAQGMCWDRYIQFLIDTSLRSHYIFRGVITMWWYQTKGKSWVVRHMLVLLFWSLVFLLSVRMPE
jgi:hypothetical protein